MYVVIVPQSRSSTNRSVFFGADRLSRVVDRAGSRAGRTGQRHRRCHRHVCRSHMASIQFTSSFITAELDQRPFFDRWFLHDYLPSHPSPRTRRRNPLSTPHWFARLFGPPAPRSTVRSGAGFTMMRPSTGRASGVAAGGAGLRERASGGYAWGSGGQRLGDS